MCAPQNGANGWQNLRMDSWAKKESAATITGSLTPKQWRQQPFHNKLVKYNSETQLDESETFVVSTNGTAGEICRLRHMHKLITISC